MMRLEDTFPENSLKCDFPARESFRESLISDLLSMDEGELQRASSNRTFDTCKDEDWAFELGDDELEMLAAARGDGFITRHPIENWN